MKRLFVIALLTAAIAVVALALVHSPAVGQDRGGGPAQVQPFQGKFLSLVTRSSPTTAVEIEKVQMKKLEGRSFLVGTGIDVPGNWQKGLEVWVAFDEVATITVFATLEEFKRGILPRDASSTTR